MATHIIRPRGLHRLASRPDRWVDGEGMPVTSTELLARLTALRIPPAWTHVWAAEDTDSRVQAIGLDSRGRTQYVYSAEASAIAQADKFDHLLLFARTLPELRAQVTADLGTGTLSAASVTAAVVRLLDKGLLRVGNERYARDNHTYGVTTMRRSHVTVASASVEFEFVGKEHVAHLIAVKDSEVARIVADLLNQDGDPDAHLFATREHSLWRRIDSATVNSYVHAHAGATGSAKTFRTWGATVAAVAVAAGADFALPDGTRARSSTLPFYAAASLLGDTVGVARASYVHPRAIDIAGLAAVRASRSAAADRVGSNAVEAVRSDQGFQRTVLDELADGRD